MSNSAEETTKGIPPSKVALVVAIIAAAVATVLFITSISIAVVVRSTTAQARSEYDALSQSIERTQGEIESSKTRLEDLKNSPEMEEYKADEVKAQKWCEQSGLGTLELLNEDNVLFGEVLGETKYGAKIASQKCEEKVNAAEQTLGVQLALTGTVTVTCEGKANTVLVRGAFKGLPENAIPKGLDTEKLDLRFKLETLRGGQVLDGASRDLLAVSVGEERSLEAEIPFSGSAPDQCQIRLESWWPTGL